MHAGDSIQSNEESNGFSSDRSVNADAGRCRVLQGAFDAVPPVVERQGVPAAASIMEAAAPSALQRIWM